MTSHRLGLESAVSEWLRGAIGLTISTLLHSRADCSVVIKFSIVKLGCVFHFIILRYGLLEHLLI